MKQRVFSALLLGLSCAGFFCGTEALAGAPGAAASVVPGIYTLCSAQDSDFVLDIKTCTVKESTDPGTELQMYRALNVNQQNYYLEKLGDVYRLSALVSGYALASDGTFSPSGEDAQNGSLLLSELQQHAEPSVRASQTWNIYQTEDGYFCLESASGGFLTVSDSDLYNGAPLTLSDFTGDKTQQWVFRRAWIGSEDYANTDLYNPYLEDGKYHRLRLSMWFGTKKETLTSELLAGWMKEDADHQLVLDPDGVRSFVNSLAQKYDTQGQPRTFTTTGGETITLYKGNFGWKLDEQNMTELLISSAQSSTPRFVSPVWSHKGNSVPGEDAIGDSYVEVDLTGQKVWLYQDGVQLLETDCVSGTFGTDRQTPGGVYSVFYMQSPAVLRGADYTSPVDYWIAFNNGIGLHDANWRNSFGGEIFRTNGSHGCVNLPTDAAKKIYETVSIGYPVVCYN